MSEKRFDFIVEACKQIITLSSAELALVAVFKDKFLQNHKFPTELYIFVVLAILSCLLSLVCILTTAGVIQRAIECDQQPTIYKSPLRYMFSTLLVIYGATLYFLAAGSLRTL